MGYGRTTCSLGEFAWNRFASRWLTNVSRYVPDVLCHLIVRRLWQNYSKAVCVLVTSCDTPSIAQIHRAMRWAQFPRTVVLMPTSFTKEE
jgi:hypothetical protein